VQHRERDLKDLKAKLAEVNELYLASWQEIQNLHFEVSRSRFKGQTRSTSERCR